MRKFESMYNTNKYDNTEVNVMKIDNSEITEGFENSILYNMDDIINKYESHNYSSLNRNNIDGSIISTYYDDDKLKHIFLPKSHKMIVGTTGSGKTQSYIMPYLRIMSTIRNKHSFCISDLKGELYQYLGTHLKKQGYKVKVLNFKDSTKSDLWNPLRKAYDLYQDYINIENKVEEKEGDPLLYTNELVKFPKKQPQKWYLFEGKAYPNKKIVNNVVESIKEKLNVDMEKIIDKVAYSVIKTTSKDPFWSDSARELFKAIIFRLLELSNENAIDEKKFNLRNIVNIASTYSTDELKEMFSEVKKGSMADRLSNKIIGISANVTRDGIFSTLSTSVAQFKSFNIQRVTIDDTLEMSTFDDQPVALFLVMNDLDKECYDIAKLVVTYLYKELSDIADSHVDKKLSRPFDFVLDEFCNIPTIEDFTNMISTSRSKDIWFTFAIQSYSQLDEKYGKDTRETILNNTNIEIFFGTNDHKTKIEFSEKCGKKTKISNTCYTNGKDETIDVYNKETVNIVTNSDLSYIPEDYCYMRILNYPCMKSKLERFYKITEFKNDLASFDECDNLTTLKLSDYYFDFNEYQSKKEKKTFRGMSFDDWFNNN